jgi:hypothetical protein
MNMLRGGFTERGDGCKDRKIVNAERRGSDESGRPRPPAFPHYYFFFELPRWVVSAAVSCEIEIERPATWRFPVREAPGFFATEKVIVFVPVREAPVVTVTQLTELVEVHAHALLVVTDTVPDPPFSANAKLVADTA